MKYNNAFNHIASQRDSISATDRYLRDTARDEALIRSYGLTTNYSSTPSSYSGYRQQAAQKACTALDNIKKNHLINLNNKMVSVLRDVLTEEDIAKIQNKDISLNSPNLLRNNPAFKRALQSNPELLAKYNEIVEAVSTPIDAKKQQILQLIQTDYGSAQHVEASQNHFEQQFRVSDYFEYIDEKCQAPICKPIVTEIAEQITESVAEAKQELDEESNIQGSSGSSGQSQHNQGNQTEPLIPSQQFPANQEHNPLQPFSSNFSQLSPIRQEEELNQHIQSLSDSDMQQNLASMIAEVNQDEHSSHSSSSDKQQQLDFIKSILEEHTHKLSNLEAQLANSFDESNVKLQEYYQGFINEANMIFTSAQAFLAGQVKTEGSNSIKVKITTHMMRAVPFIGQEIADGIQVGADYKVKVEEQRKCKLISQFGTCTSHLERKAKYLAKSIGLDENMQQLIEDYQPLEPNGIFNRMSKFTNALKLKFDNEIQSFKNGQTSAQALLGHKHAAFIINEYICSGKILTMDKDNLLLDMVKHFVQDTFTPNEQEQNDEPSRKEEEDVDAPEVASSSQNNSGQEEQPSSQEQAQMLQPAIPKSSAVVEGVNDGEEQQEQELTPKSKQIKEMQEMMARMREEIQTLKTNPDSEKWISREDVQHIMQENTVEKNRLLDDNRTLQQESEAKDGIINSQRDTNTALLEENHTVKDKLQNEIKTNQRHERQIDDLYADKTELRKTVSKLEHKVDKLKVQKETQAKEIDDLKKLLAHEDASDTTIVNIIHQSENDEQYIQASGVNSGIAEDQMLA